LSPISTHSQSSVQAEVTFKFYYPQNFCLAVTA
jgi:hypothetical protein